MMMGEADVVVVGTAGAGAEAAGAAQGAAGEPGTRRGGGGP